MAFDISTVHNMPTTQEYGSIAAGGMNPYQIIRNVLGLGLGGGGTASEGGTTVASGGTPPAGLSSDLTTILGDIPLANDGDVVSADYHNTLRAAILALAGYLGQGGLNQAVVQTLAPALLAVEPLNGFSEWQVNPMRAVANGSSEGWLALELPDGALIQSITAINERASKADSLTVRLDRYALTTPTAELITLAELDKQGGDGTIQTDTAPFSVTQFTGQGVIAELQRVDNSSYRYVIYAKAQGVAEPAVEGVGAGGGGGPKPPVAIYALQVAYTRW
jgi:hypothetical protein